MPKRRIVIRDFIKDVLAGKSEFDLMHTYELDAWGLSNALEKMVEIRAITLEQLLERLPSFQFSTQGSDRRQLPRQYVLFSFPVYVANDLGIEGFVNDITERGLQAAGIRCQVGEAKSLLIRADEFADIYPFVFDATCRWINEEDPYGEFVAGFEITDISAGGLFELRKLITMLAFH